MRTAKILKHLSFGAVAASVWAALRLFPPSAADFWIVVLGGILLTLILRVLANTGQIVYEAKAELAKSAANMERSLYQVSALLKEIRDLMESRRP